MTDAEIDEIDRFIADFKTLDGLMPEWHDHFRREWQVRWPILDANHIACGVLSFTCDAKLNYPSIAATYQHKMFYRLDIAPVGECKDNPFSAMELGLPSRVCGPHVHDWHYNKEYVRVNGFGDLPHRRLIDGAVNSLANGLAWVISDLNLTVTSEQRVCQMPAQGGLFSRW